MFLVPSKYSRVHLTSDRIWSTVLHYSHVTFSIARYFTKYIDLCWSRHLPHSCASLDCAVYMLNDASSSIKPQMGIPFVNAPYVYLKQMAYQNVTPVQRLPFSSLVHLDIARCCNRYCPASIKQLQVLDVGNWMKIPITMFLVSPACGLCFSKLPT